MSAPDSNVAYIGLGSNLENPLQQLQQAIERLNGIAHTQCISTSHFYGSSAVGPGEQPDYVNAAACLHTKLSAIELKANLTGLKVGFDSLATLVTGGIAFDTPEEALRVAAPLPTHYHLFPSKFDADLENDIITIVAKRAYHLDPTFSQVFYRGFKAGKIVSIHYDPIQAQTIFKIRLKKRFLPLANKKTWFWIVQPQIGLRAFKGLDALVGGPYIAFETADMNALKQRHFALHEDPIPAKGKTIRLSAMYAESIKSGTTIFYRDIPIGRIRTIRLVPGKKKLNIEAVIFEKYQHFLNDSSMFYVKSGIEAEMALNGIHLKSGSLETLAVGGVAMETLQTNAKRTKDRFFVFKDYKTFRKARYLKSGGIRYHIVMDELGSLSKGSPVLYKRVKAGEVINYRYLPKEDKIDVLIFIQKEFRNHINQSTRFRNVSGVELQLDFPRAKIKMDTVESLLLGGLRFDTPNLKAPKAKEGYRFVLFDEEKDKRVRYTTFELWMERSYGLKVGSPLLYRGIKVGYVDQLALHGNTVEAQILLEKRYASLLREDTYFWLKTLNVGLGGIKNVETAISGPAIAMVPGRSPHKESHFHLVKTPPPPTYGRQGLRIRLEADRRGSLKVGSPVYYRQVRIGEVEAWALRDDGTAVEIELFVEPRYAHLVRANAIFYMAGGIGMEIGLTGAKIRTETMQTILSGGIGMVVPDRPGTIVEDTHVFKLMNERKASWGKWHPKL